MRSRIFLNSSILFIQSVLAHLIFIAVAYIVVEKMSGGSLDLVAGGSLLALSFGLVGGLAQMVYTISGFSRIHASIDRIMREFSSESKISTTKTIAPSLSGKLVVMRKRTERDINTAFTYRYHFCDSGLYVLYGQSGSGKTTFLEALAGIHALEEGSSLENDAIYIPSSPIVPSTTKLSGSGKSSKLSALLHGINSNSKIVLLDEPLTGLEPHEQKYFFDTLKNHSCKLILATSHQKFPIHLGPIYVSIDSTKIG